MLVLVGSLLTSFDSPAYASSLDGVRPLLLECFRRAEPASCNRALEMTEALQRRAAERELYPCQTFLLGLQAEVVMAQLGEKRFEQASMTMQDSERLCAAL